MTAQLPRPGGSLRLDALGDELLHVALQLDPDSHRALRAASKTMRARLDACCVLSEWLCTTGAEHSFCFDRTWNHFTKTHQPVPAGSGRRIPGSRWAVGDVAFVAFANRLLARRIPDGSFYEITPVPCEGSAITFAAGWGSEVWVGLGPSVTAPSSRLVHARLTPDLTGLERLLSITQLEDEPRVWCVCANQFGLVGVRGRSVLLWGGSAWRPLVPKLDEINHAIMGPDEDALVSAAPDGTIWMAYDNPNEGTDLCKFLD
jgi:hypothetical protein